MQEKRQLLLEAVPAFLPSSSRMNGAFARERGISHRNAQFLNVRITPGFHGHRERPFSNLRGLCILVQCGKGSGQLLGGASDGAGLSGPPLTRGGEGGAGGRGARWGCRLLRRFKNGRSRICGRFVS
jgi:hypothetical protein